MKIISKHYESTANGEAQRRSEGESYTPDAAPEVSVVIPCLNEADTLAICIEKAARAFRSHNIRGEIIVADNGSTDGSQEIALQKGARLVHVQVKGYGSALMGGISQAKANIIIMGDGDDSYDFEQIPRFVEKLRHGYDLVQGCRLPSGGGKVLPGAMPFLHRWFGNPLFSSLAKIWFHAPIHDIYCGMRAFTKTLYDRLDLRCTGMEFATEMIIKAALYRASIAELPITLHPDGRKSHPPHLKTFLDGWRTLRFFLISSPKWLFLVPGIFLFFVGVSGYMIALPGLKVSGITFDAHTLLVASMSIFLGYQLIFFAILTKTFGINEGFLPPDPRLDSFFKFVTIEKGLILGGLCMVCGLALILVAVNEWRSLHFGQLDYAHTMRWVIPGVTLTTLGLQNIFSSFIVSIIGVRRR